MFFQNKTSANFFESRYRRSADPWKFASSDYEQGRYKRILAALDGKRFRRAFEPGCSVGVLTEQLAAICDSVDAYDFSATAAENARQRCAHLPGVTIRCAAFNGDTCLAGYDLVLLSEIGYYFKLPVWRSMVANLVSSMDPGTTVLASHWLGKSRDHHLHGDQVHEVLRADPRLQLQHEERNKGFRLDRFLRQ